MHGNLTSDARGKKGSKTCSYVGVQLINYYALEASFSCAYFVRPKMGEYGGKAPFYMDTKTPTTSQVTSKRRRQSL